MKDYFLSTVTDKMSRDVDPADHVPESGPPLKIIDQIFAVSYSSNLGS